MQKNNRYTRQKNFSKHQNFTQSTIEPLEEKQESPTKGFLKNFSLSDGLIIAAVTGSSYGMYFIYYLGYFGVFGIPIQYLAFDTPSLLVIALLFAQVSIYIWVFGDEIINNLLT